MGGGQFQAEGVPGFQQDAPGAHQPLAHRPVGGLAEVAALCVLFMGPARRQGDAHIRDGGAGENPQVGLFPEVGQDQALPVGRQLVLRTNSGELEAAAPRQGLQKQVDLGVMPQGLEMAHALHRGGNGLPVDHPARAESGVDAETLLQAALENFDLDLAHQLDPDLPTGPGHVELGVFLLQLPQGLQGRGGVRVRLDPIGQHRLQGRNRPGCLEAKALAGEGAAQAGDGHYRPGGGLVHKLKFCAGVDSELVRFFLPDLLFRDAVPAVGQEILRFQDAAGDLQVRQPGAPAVPGDLEDPGAELRRIGPRGGVAANGSQQLLHALQLQRGAKEAGEELTAGNQARQFVLRHFAGLQITLQQGLVTDGGLLRQGLRRKGEVRAAAVQAGFQLPQQGGLVRARQVHLVDEQEHRDLIALQETPEGSGVGLDAVAAADDQNGAVQDLEDPLRLGGEVHVARGIQQGDIQAVQVKLRLLREDGDAPLPLHGVGIQEGVPVVHPAQAADGPAPVQQGLGQRGLPRVYVSQDAGDQFV